MTLEQDILRILNDLKSQIQANMADKGINASGRTSRSFAVEKAEGGYRLVLKHDTQVAVDLSPRGMYLGRIVAGVAPLQTLEIGRPAGKVPKGFYYIIKQWTRDKGLNFSKESERQTFSYFLARKIARKGTQRNTNHVNVYTIPVNRAKEEIQNDIRASIIGVLMNAAKSNKVL